jgi:hypothetical protein
MRRAVLFVLLVLFSCDAASALDVTGGNRSIFLFGGVMRDGTFPGWTMIPFSGGVEHNYLVGAALDTDYVFDGNFQFGTEIGSAGRFGNGQDSSVEVWGGPSVHYRYIAIGSVEMSLGFVAGLSAVSDTIGIKRQREIDNSGNAKLLFYLGPEVEFRIPQAPNVEFVVRTHHRSGAEGRLGHMREGANANLFGFRVGF